MKINTLKEIRPIYKSEREALRQKVVKLVKEYQKSNIFMDELTKEQEDYLLELWREECNLANLNL